MNRTVLSRFAASSTLALFLAVAVAAGALAGESRQITGYDIVFTSVSDTTDLGNGHSVLIFRGNTVNVLADRSDPVHLTTGPCTGMVEIFPGGTFQGRGYCTRKDRDGHTYAVRWWRDKGAARGNWEIIAGSGNGKWEGVTGGGWFEGQMAEGAIAANAWSGTITSK